MPADGVRLELESLDPLRPSIKLKAVSSARVELAIDHSISQKNNSQNYYNITTAFFRRSPGIERDPPR